MADSPVSALGPPKPPTPKPRYTPAQVITALHGARGMVSGAARALKCDPDTVRNYVKRYPTVAAAMQEERETTTDIAELALYRAIEAGESWAVRYYLSTQGKARGYVERAELTGADGKALAVDVQLNADSLARLWQQAQARAHAAEGAE